MNNPSSPSPLLTTSTIPPQYWKPARLTGKTPFFALQSDPRFSYCLYIPPSHYTPSTTPQTLPLIIHIHGSLRRAQGCRDTLIPLADRTGAAVLAPLFPCGIESPNDMHGYKFLSTGKVRYDLVLLAVLEEVALRWPGIDTGKFLMHGFSGGGQFALRFLYLYPERLHGVCIGAPGVVTRLDQDVPWPVGIQDVAGYFDGRSVDLDAIRRVPYIRLVVGGDDTAEVNEGLYELLPKEDGEFGATFQAYAEKGLPGRLEALTDLHEELRGVGVESELSVIPGVAHSVDGVESHVIEWLGERLVELAKG